uniref:Uncharacterized protein n=1 Tax=Anguilla anguilla TaxID=7936 RepID=A0A0E9WB07_ANGAN
MDFDPPDCSSSGSKKEGVSIGFRRSSKCSSHLSTISPAEVRVSPFLLTTA